MGLVFFAITFLSLTEPFGFSFLAASFGPFVCSKRLVSDVVEATEATGSCVSTLHDLANKDMVA